MKKVLRAGLLVVVFSIAFAPAVLAQAGAGGAAPPPCPAGPTRCISVSFRDAEIQDVIASFAEFSGYSIVLGAGIGGTVTAEIRNQPWDVAMQAILQAQGLEGREAQTGLIRVDAAERLREREVQEALVTRAFRINYVPVQELAASLAPLVSERGSISTNPSTNMLIVTDTPSSLSRIAALVGQPLR
jgi:type IV pilus assembly protein PilQ